MAYGPEDWEQIAVVDYCELKHYDIFAIPNGGSRNKIEAKKMKRTGTKKGIPDLFLPCSKHGCHGLFIELKAKGGRATAEQKEWIERLNANGYKAVICYGFDEAKETIDWYMGE